LLPVAGPQSSTLFPYTTLFRSSSLSWRSCDDLPGEAPRHRALGVARGQRLLARDHHDAFRARPSTAARAETRSAHARRGPPAGRSEEHTSELQSRENLVCRLLL